MTRTRYTVATLAAVAAVAAGCASEPTRPAPTVPPPSPLDVAANAALGTYERFWGLVVASQSAPTARDWTTELEAVASGQALATAQLDIANYASLPAHLVGQVNRAPRAEHIDIDRVTVLDCVDLGDSRLVRDTSGEVLDDLANRVQRYRYRATVIRDTATGRWLVDTTAPARDEPC